MEQQTYEKVTTLTIYIDDWPNRVGERALLGENCVTCSPATACGATTP